MSHFRSVTVTCVTQKYVIFWRPDIPSDNIHVKLQLRTLTEKSCIFEQNIQTQKNITVCT